MAKIVKELIGIIILLFLILVVIPLVFDFVSLSGNGFSVVRFFIAVMGVFTINFVIGEIIE